MSSDEDIELGLGYSRHNDASDRDIDGAIDKNIQLAVNHLGRAGLVVVPTETVYGLAADICQTEAVSRIFAVKSRPLGHPLIVHISDSAQLETWAHSISDQAWGLARKFWPGPMTLILKRKSVVPGIVTGEQDTVGIRIPDHPLTLKLLQLFSRHHSGAVVAPSANRFGKISPTTMGHAWDEFGDSVDFYLDGGPCQVGIESTIVDVSGSLPRILRPGTISQQDIANALGVFPDIGQHQPAARVIRVSGNLQSHYAPKTPLKLIETKSLRLSVVRWISENAPDHDGNRSVFEGVQAGHVPEKSATGERESSKLPQSREPTVAVLGFENIEMDGIFFIRAEKNPNGYARNLYAWLRQLDSVGSQQIFVEAPPRSNAWCGIWDRLQRASAADSI